MSIGLRFCPELDALMTGAWLVNRGYIDLGSIDILHCERLTVNDCCYERSKSVGAAQIRKAMAFLRASLIVAKVFR